ncbi:MAG: aminoglycoside phosphotransferase family protein [Chloroflexota bacterium]|nr:aminoglycoside phosphotransferase family protein [Chloroflexota bacterium]
MMSNSGQIQPGEYSLPPGFCRRIDKTFGEEGREWLEGLPALLDRCAQHWSLQLLAPFEPLSYNYVAPAILLDGSQAVLKAGVPNPELYSEMAALQLYDGRGIVGLLAYDADLGAMLLERLQPGSPLRLVQDDEQATAIAAQVMQRLWRPVPANYSFKSVGDWAQGLGRLREQFGGGTGPLPEELVVLAENLFEELLRSMGKSVLLHGDLHHDNIVAAERSPWLALDPKGIVGEAAYETGALLRNPLPWLLEQPDPQRVLARRVDQLGELLGFDRQRLVRWGIAQAVLSAVWTVEDHGTGWQSQIAIARHLAGVMAI